MLFRIFKSFRDITVNGTTLQAKINDNLIFTSSDNSILINLSQVAGGKRVDFRNVGGGGGGGPSFGKVRGVNSPDIAQADQVLDLLLIKSTGGTISAVASDTDDSVDLNVVNNTSIQKIEVTDGIVTSIRKRINFIGSGVNITVTDNPDDDRADVTITATATNSFGIVWDGLNSAVADSASDTLTLKSADGSIAISASDTDDSVNLGVNVFNFGKVSDGTNLAVADALEDTLFLKSTSNTISVVVSNGDDSVDLNVNDDTSIQKVEVAGGGSLIGTRKRLNFVNAFTITDDSVNNRVNLTFNINNFGKVTDETNTAIADTLQDTLLVKSTDNSVSVVVSDSDDSIDFKVESIVISLVAGENINKGDPCYIDSNTNKVFRAQASNVNKMPVTIVASESITINNLGRFIVAGKLTGMTFNSTDVGKILYVDSAGSLTTTKPSIDTNIIQKVGVVVSTTSMIVDIDDIQRVKIQDTLTLVAAFNNQLYFGTKATSYVLVAQTNLNLDNYKVLGAIRLFRFEVFAWISSAGSSGSVQLYDSTNGVVLGVVTVTATSPTKYIIDVTANMPVSGEITLSLQASSSSSVNEVFINQAQLEISIAN